MPRKPKHPCHYPGCPNLTDGQYCEVHRKIARRQYDKYERAENVKKIYGRKWEKVRDQYIKLHPLCEDCLANGIIRLAKEVHHKVPVSRGGTHEVSNLRSLCKSCHNKKHIEMGDR